MPYLRPDFFNLPIGQHFYELIHNHMPAKNMAQPLLLEMQDMHHGKLPIA